MITTVEAGRTYLVEATEPHALEQDLNTAVEQASRYARQEGRHGVLVTRYGYATFTVAVSTKVPFGQTQEEDGLA
jgi:hypothetical protein